MTPAEPPVLIYDGDCPMCRRAARWALDHVESGGIEVLPCQAPERAERFPGVTREACLEALHLITPGGTVYVGDRALPPLLRLAGEHRAAAWALDLPGVRSWLAPAVYRWVARHRQGLSAFFKSEPSAPQGCGCPEDKESDDTP